MLRQIYDLTLDLGNEEAVKERALSIGGESTFCLAYYFVIESKGKEGEVSHFHDMTTETQRVCMIFPRHSYSNSKFTQPFPTAPCPWVYHKYQMSHVFSKVL